MTYRFSQRAGLICLALAAASTAGCSSRGDKADRPENPFRNSAASPGAPLSERELRLEADQAYRRAHESLVASDYETAITRFTGLIAKYPFSDYATQAELEKIYAQYRSFQPDEAVIAADRFLREHPRHPNADYVQYIKGLVDYGRDAGIIDYLPLDNSKRDATNARRAYDDFALLLQKYPNSRYAGDARQRMVYLRNKVAAHELSVAQYYLKRGAWVAASKRAESIIAEYPGAPATADALLLLQEAYDKLGQTAQAAELKQLIAANAASLSAARAPKSKAAPLAVVQRADDAATIVPVAPGTAAATPAAEPSKGFFGTIGSLFNFLNSSYTVGADGKAAATGATAASATAAAPPAPEFGAPGSLTTGPYSGPQTSVTLPVGGNPPATAAASAAAAAPAATTAAPDAPKEKKGFFDFLNRTYVIGGSKKAAAEAAAPAAAETPAAASPAAAPAAAAAAPAPAAAAAATPAATTEKPKSRGWSLDFLNRTYKLGGDSAKPADAPATPAADTVGSKPGSGLRVYLDYGDEEAKKKAEAEAAAKAAADPAAAPATAEKPPQ